MSIRRDNILSLDVRSLCFHAAFNASLTSRLLYTRLLVLLFTYLPSGQIHKAYSTFESFYTVHTNMIRRYLLRRLLYSAFAINVKRRRLFLWHLMYSKLHSFTYLNMILCSYREIIYIFPDIFQYYKQLIRNNIILV